MARRKAISKLRDKASFRRPAGRTPPRSVTLIVCEGETEQAYIEAVRNKYRLSTAEVILAPNTAGSAPISVVQCAVARCGERGGYDKIVCVFDRDGHESFDRARQRIQALAGRKRNPLPIEEAISIPCFELWVLLHFEQTDAPFSCCDDVIQRIRTHHMANYQKADGAVARQLMEKVLTAVANADWLEGRAEHNNQNPYTSVHKLLRHLALVAGGGGEP